MPLSVEHPAPDSTCTRAVRTISLSETLVRQVSKMKIEPLPSLNATKCASACTQHNMQVHRTYHNSAGTVRPISWATGACSLQEVNKPRNHLVCGSWGPWREKQFRCFRHSVCVRRVVAEAARNRLSRKQQPKKEESYVLQVGSTTTVTAANTCRAKLTCTYDMHTHICYDRSLTHPLGTRNTVKQDSGRATCRLQHIIYRPTTTYAIPAYTITWQSLSYKLLPPVQLRSVTVRV